MLSELKTNLFLVNIYPKNIGTMKGVTDVQLKDAIRSTKICRVLAIMLVKCTVIPKK